MIVSMSDPPDSSLQNDADEEIVSADAPDSPEEADVLHFHFRATKKQARRIDQFLVDRLPWLSRAAVQRLIDEELVKVNAKPTKAAYKIKSGDLVEMVAPPQPVNDLAPEPIPLDIIYEDEHFLALNKQADLIVHPARGRWTGTLVNGLVNYGKKWSTVNGDWRPGILHRLDRNTTGVMLVAKSDEAHWRLARQFENRTIQKTYLAVVHGVPHLLGDVIDMPIGRDRYIREKQAVRKLENGGKPAVTIYQVRQTFESGKEQLGQSSFASDQKLPAPPPRFALVQLSPRTGRTHQLRVHMSARGHPIVGDTMYGGRIYQSGAWQFARQALHAHEITLIHPATLQPMTLTAPLPADMRELISHLEAGK